jgi:electron transport complex protein RnfG
MDSSPVRLVLAVVVACAASAAGLSLTYAATAEQIAEQERIARDRSLEAALPGSASFEEIDDEDVLEEAEDLTDDVLVAAYCAYDEGGAHIGWGVEVAPRGYGGPIQMVVGLERDGKVAGVSIISNRETPGLGTKVEEDAFLDQFTSWTAVTIDEDAKDLDAVSGATKSSNGVRDGVLAAGYVYELLDEEGGCADDG